MSAAPANGQSRRPRRMRRTRKLLFTLLTAMLVLALVEGCAWLLLYVRWGGHEQVANQLDGAVGSQTTEGAAAPRIEVNHPYLGYVMHLDNDDYHVQGVDPFSVTDYGFYDSAGPLRQRAPDKVIVGITGGSVAHEFSVLSSDVLAETLRERFPDQDIEFVRLALPGYKQPQQLMSLNYVLTLGGELDLLINIDGFNEVALPGHENVSHDVFSAFPRSWHLRVVTGNDIPLMRAIGYTTYCREERRELAESFQPFRWSPTAMLIWKSRTTGIENRLLQAIADAQMLRSLDQGFGAQGPEEEFESEETMYRRLAEIWTDASIQMHRLCSANGIEYYHFLQPTRHYPEVDSSETTAHIVENVQRGYPVLQRQGGVLREQDVAFFDLTDIFDPLQEGIYVDFCHFNNDANDQMAERIGNRIVEQAATE